LVAAWVLAHDGDFRMDPEDPPLFKYYVALGTRSDDMPRNYASPEWTALLGELAALGKFARATLYQTAGTDADALLAAARARMILLGIALGLLIAWWSWRLAGPLAAVVALAAFCLDPNFLAHAPLVKGDVPTALLFLSLMTAIWLLGEWATAPRGLATALLLGAAIMTKYSGILGIPILAVALLCRALGPMPWRVLHWTARTRRARLAAGAAIAAGAIVVVYIMLWGCYSFRFGPAHDPGQLFDMREVVDLCRANQYGQVYAGKAIGTSWRLRPGSMAFWFFTPLPLLE
jgi:4-amino-4-deoxy-L-arabinose transferase-like glycosyltransferase